MKKLAHNCLYFLENSVRGIHIIAGIMILALVISMMPNKSSDKYALSRVVQLVGNNHSCSGEQIRAPSGADYILTAAHCRPIAVDGSMTVRTEDGRALQRKIIAEDHNSDLLLLEGIPNLKGIEIAKSSEQFQHVRTLTHGMALKTHKTEGELIERRNVVILLYIVDKENSAEKCNSMAKQHTLNVMTIFGSLDVCLLDTIEMYSTAKVAHGSSGGMVLDDDGRLVGVVSASESSEGFSMFVDQVEINNFISNY